MELNTTTTPLPTTPPINGNPGGFFTLDVPVIVCVLLLWRELVSLKTQLTQQINELCKVAAKLETVVEQLLSRQTPPP
jgi:hypothetical protein